MSKARALLFIGSVMVCGQAANAQWVNYRLNSYMISDQAMDWKTARTWAEGHGGHLVTITDVDENAFVLATFATPGVGIWMGLEQDCGDPACSGECEPACGWKWITGEPLSFQNWAPNEPNDMGGAEHNGEMYAQDNVNLPGGWNDDMQASVLRAVVERDNSIPAVSEWGLVVMALLVLSAGTVVLIRRRRAAIA